MERKSKGYSGGRRVRVGGGWLEGDERERGEGGGGGEKKGEGVGWEHDYIILSRSRRTW